MQWLTTLCVLALVYGGGGVTKSPGLSEFWTDDYKVFEQIYGKTSDKELYGPNLPTISVSAERPRGQASEKKERFAANEAFGDIPSYTFGDKYAEIVSKQLDEQKKPLKTFNFVSYNDFKPISQYSDPETYKYLKNLERFTQDQKTTFPNGAGGFKPYVSYGDDPEEQAYKSIQDILEAHDANSGSKSVEDDDIQPNYVNYNSGKSRKKSAPRKKPDEFNKPNNRCWSGRCRKRATTSVRARTRPYIRKVTQSRWHNG